MGLALKRFKVYLKLGAIIAIVLIVLLIVFMNRNHKAEIWFFGLVDEPINVLWLILVTAIVSIIGWWVVSKIIGVVREVRQVRQSVKMDQQLDEQRRMAEQLADREKRIDEKVRRSITEES